MPEGLMTADGGKLRTAPAGKPDVSEFEAALAAAATDAVLPDHTPPKREKAIPDPDEAAKIRRESARPRPKDKPRAAPAPKAKADARAQRVDGVKGIVQVGAAVCLVLDQRTPDTDISFQADAVTLAGSSDAIAAAIADTCEKSETFARAVDRVTQAGPYAALVTVMLATGAQLAMNHGMKFAASLGAVPPEQLLSADLDKAA